MMSAPTGANMAGAITVAGVITMDGVEAIITVGETSLGDYSERSRLSLAAFSFGGNMHRLRGHTQKPPRVFLDGSCRCVLL